MKQLYLGSDTARIWNTGPSSKMLVFRPRLARRLGLDKVQSVQYYVDAEANQLLLVLHDRSADEVEAAWPLLFRRNTGAYCAFQSVFARSGLRLQSDQLFRVQRTEYEGRPALLLTPIDSAAVAV